MVGRESRIAVVVNGNAKNVNEDVISTIDQILKGGAKARDRIGVLPSPT